MLSVRINRIIICKVYEGELGAIQNFAFVEELGRNKISKK